MFRSGMFGLTGVGLLLALCVSAGSAQKDSPKGKDKGKDKAKDQGKDKGKAKDKSKVNPRIIEEIKSKDKRDKSRDPDLPKRSKWEYCSLTLKVDSSAKTKKFIWTVGNTTTEAPTLKDLGEKIKMKVVPTTKTAVLNYLGEDGWELVNYTGTFAKADVSYDMYYLKRRK